MGKSNKSVMSDSPTDTDSDSEVTPMVDTGSPFDATILDQLEEKEQSKPRKPRQPKKPKTPKLTQIEKDVVVKPLFGVANIFLVKFDIQPLDDMEINTGVEAFTPLIEKYMPLIGDNAIFIMPLLWTAGVVARRIPEPTVEIPEELHVTETKNSQGSQSDSALAQ